MAGFEVEQPILCPPFDEPGEHWELAEGEEARRVRGRRPASYLWRDPGAGVREAGGGARAVPLALVNLVRLRLGEWRRAGYPGATKTTLELLGWWRRPEREQRLFFAQLEAAETILFLLEARRDLLQGIEVPADDPGEQKQAAGHKAFRRYACKMATGAGKTTVMGMLCAWSILNKVNQRADGRFSDTVIVVCPNVTIRQRLSELKPERSEASVYWTRDLVPPVLRPLLLRGRVLVTNWHVFEPHDVQVGGVSARVARSGVEVRTTETVTIGDKTTTARGSRYMTRQLFEAQVATGAVRVLEVKEKEADGSPRKVKVEATRYVESDGALVNRVIGREVGGKQNLLVLNDEAHHAYRIPPQEADEDGDDEDEEETLEEFRREATVWVDGLDRIHKLRGVNFCVDLSATPYFLSRVGAQGSRPFPWIVSDFGLADAIESGLVKIPELAVRDAGGADQSHYYNLWPWIRSQLSGAERGGARGTIRPEAVLRYAATPLTLLGHDWEKTWRSWQEVGREQPPVFIVVCKNTKIAKVVHGWLSGVDPPAGLPPCTIEGFRNRDGEVPTIRVDTKVVEETDSGEANADEDRWMRFTLDTVGKGAWPTDRQGRAIYPEGFEALAVKLDRSLGPPGRGVRCMVSVGMLTEGWDCTTVTHIIGLRPFMSQLLCEQVAGRGLRRSSYEPGPDGRLGEEVAKILGVPFEVIPFKASGLGPPREVSEKKHVHALASRAALEIRFPRVERYTQAIRNRVSIDWKTVAQLVLDPIKIPPEVELKATIPGAQSRPSLLGPGGIQNLNLNPFRKGRRVQELAFELACQLTREILAADTCQVPAQALFPQVLPIAHRYLVEKIEPRPPAEVVDVFLSPYFGLALERLRNAIRPAVSEGEAAELPVYERNRGPGSSADVDFMTSRPTVETTRSHVNYVVADTLRWEQSAAGQIDRHRRVEAFVKNAGLGFAIPYWHADQGHDYIPDFIVRLKGDKPINLVLETKGYDELLEVKRAAAERWVAAVNVDGTHGTWRYELAIRPELVTGILDRVAG